MTSRINNDPAFISWWPSTKYIYKKKLFLYYSYIKLAHIATHMIFRNMKQTKIHPEIPNLLQLRPQITVSLFEPVFPASVGIGNDPFSNQKQRNGRFFMFFWFVRLQEANCCWQFLTFLLESSQNFFKWFESSEFCMSFCEESLTKARFFGCGGKGCSKFPENSPTNFFKQDNRSKNATLYKCTDLHAYITIHRYIDMCAIPETGWDDITLNDLHSTWYVAAHPGHDARWRVQLSFFLVAL